jgi:hypothetical protein
MNPPTTSLRLILALALGLGMTACASPEATTAPGLSPAHGGHDSATTWSGAGLLTLKGNPPFSWWALQTDLGQVWRLELPASMPAATLEPRQNCQVKASGKASEGLLGVPLLQLSSIQGVQRPELGAPENLRCQFSFTRP